ncbi:MAG: YgaP family membrane protein [Pseudomonadota bacterium]
MTFTPNVGNADRIARVVLGLVLLSMLFWVEGSGKWWGLIGVVPLFTAYTRWCPSYLPFGLNTCKR